MIASAVDARLPMTSLLLGADSRVAVDATQARTYGLALALGLVHAGVDATTVTVVFRAANVHDLTAAHAFALVLGYDVIAFGSQVLLGAGADRWKLHGHATRLGLLLCAASVGCLGWHALAAMLLAGLGNALFHLGAGALILSRGLSQSAPSGVFVAPGVLGLAFGMTYGKLPDLGPVWPLAVLLVFSLMATWQLTRTQSPLPGPQVREPAPAASRVGRLLWLTLSLLLVSVAVRSLVGFSAARGLVPSPWLFLGIPIGAFLGKALGGFVADRVGWIETTAFALLASVPCIVFGARHTAILLVGLCLFQMTMPVTLAAVARLMPGRLSTAFGWTCLALIVGALPTMFSATRSLCIRPVLAFWIILACAAVTLGLRQLGIQVRSRELRLGHNA